MRQLWLILALVALPFALGAQDDDGASTLERLIQNQLSSDAQSIQIRGFRGALSSNATLDLLTIADREGVWLRLENASLVWDRTALFSGAVKVTELSAERVTMPRLPVAEPAAEAAEASGFSIPELPVSVEIGALRVDTVALGAPVLGQAAEVSAEGAAELIEGSATATLKLDRIDGPQSELIFDLFYDAASAFLTFDTSLVEAEAGLVSTLIDLPGAPSIDLRISGAGRAADFGAELRLATDGEDRLTGDLTIANLPDDEIGFEGVLRGDVSTLIAPDYRDLLGDDLRVDLAGTRGANETDIPTISIQAQSLSADGSVRLGRDDELKNVDLAVTLQQGDGSRLSLGTGTDLARAEVTARFDAAEGDAWRIDGTLEDLIAPGAELAQATLSANGLYTPNARTLVSADVEFATEGLVLESTAGQAMAGPNLRGQGAFDYDPETGLSFENLGLAGALFSAQTTGNLDLRDGSAFLKAEGAAEVTDISPVAPLAGRLSAEFDLSQDLLGGIFDATLQGRADDLISDIEGAERFLAPGLDLSIAVGRDETGIRLEAFNFGNPEIEVAGSGTLGTAGSALSVTSNVPNLAGLPQIERGAFDLEATLTQDPGAPWQADLRGTLTDLETQIAEVNALTGGQIALEGQATAQADGTIDLPGLTLNMAEADALLQGKVTGGDVALTWTADLPNPGILTGAASGPVELEGQADLTDGILLATTRATAQNLAIGVQEVDQLLVGTSVLEAELGGPLDALSLSRADLTTRGVTVAAQGSVTPSLDLTTRVELDSLSRFVSALSGPVTAEGRVAQEEAGLTIDQALRATGGTELRAAGVALGQEGAANLAITGQIPLALANAFTTQGELTGAAELDLSLVGAPSLDALSGVVRVVNGRAISPSQGLTINNLDGTVTLSNSTAAIDIAGGSGAGRVAATGQISLASSLNTDLVLRLTQMPFENKALYRTEITGDIALRGALTQSAAVTGQLNLRDTEVRVPNALAGSEPIPDIRHLRATPRVTRALDLAGLPLEGSGATSAGGPEITLDIQIDAATPIFIRGRGLDAELDGSLQISGTAQDVVPVGGFSLTRGRLDLLGRRLTLTEGDVELTGSFDPFLNFTAEAEADTITAFVTIFGTVSNLEVRFSSNPTLPESEVLAQLIFGKNLQNLSAFQAAQLASAVNELAGRGNGGVINQLRQGLNLDDLRVDQDAEGNTSFAAGAYISENVYSEVEVGQGGQTGVRLNIDLTETVTATGRVGSDGDTSIGIFVERDY